MSGRTGGGVSRPVPGRLVLLGASNVTLAFPLLIDALRDAPGGPDEIVAAHGHGRSYGTWSRIAVRALPSVADCGLWSYLDDHPLPPERTGAVLTDVGNDIFFGHDAETILAWVRRCAEGLRRHAGTRVITGLPLESLEQFGPLGYGLLRRLFFPASPVTLDDARREAHAVQAGLETIARDTDARFVRPAADWYRLDRIHPAPWKRRDAWAHYLGPWPQWSGAVAGAPRRWRLAPRLWGLRPALWRSWGRERRRPQPVRREGARSIWLY